MRAVQASPYSPVTISVVPHRSEVAVVPVGELDLASVDEVALAVADLRDRGFDQIVLDLRGIRFIDSTGLKMLLGLRNRAEHDGHLLTLVPPQHPEAQRIFDVTLTRGLFDWRTVDWL